MGQCLGGGLLSLSLSLLALVARLWAKLKGFFTHFIVDFARFIAISSYFVVVFSHLFACKRHFLGHCAFLKFLNALFLGFLRSSLRAVFVKKAWQSINLVLFLLFGLPRSLCSLAMTAQVRFLAQNSTHFIFYPQIFAQFLLTNFTQGVKNGR